MLHDRYDEALERFLPHEFDDVDGRQDELLRVIPNHVDEIVAMVGTWPKLPGRVAQPKRLPRSWPVVKFRTVRAVKVAARRARRTFTRQGRSAESPKPGGSGGAS